MPGGGMELTSIGTNSLAEDAQGCLVVGWN